MCPACVGSRAHSVGTRLHLPEPRVSPSSRCDPCARAVICRVAGVACACTPLPSFAGSRTHEMRMHVLTCRAASATWVRFIIKWNRPSHFIVKRAQSSRERHGAFYHKTGPSMADAEALAAEVATEAAEASGEMGERPQALMASRTTTQQAGVPVGCAPGSSTWLQRGTGRRSRPVVRRRSRRATCGGRWRRGRA